MEHLPFVHSSRTVYVRSGHSGHVIYLMSITRGVLAQSLEPEAHDKVLDNNPDRI